MMLGFAKDSVLDLASLAKASTDKSFTETDDHDPPEEGGTSEVTLDLSTDSDLDLSSLLNRKGSTEATSDMSSGSNMKTSSSNGEKGQSPSSQTSSSAYGHYSGFAVDYAEYGNYHTDASLYVDPYAPTVFGLRNGEGNNFLCCLFAPWFGGKKGDQYESDNDTSSMNNEPTEREEVLSEDGKRPKSVNSDDDDYSTGSEVYGEKLTDKDRLAVLARLRLSQPDPSLVEASSNPKGKGLLNEFQTYHVNSGPGNYDSDKSDPSQSDDGFNDSYKPKLKGILKRKSSIKLAVSPGSSVSSRNALTTSSEQASRRRSLFPTYEDKKTSFSPDNDNHVRFAPMARVVTVKSKNDMTFMEKSMVWWQKIDYDNFKKAGRIIAKAMLEGGSEIWLTTRPSTSNASKLPLRRGNVSASSTSAGAQRSYHLSDREKFVRSQNPGDDMNSEDCGNKWWCKFGHSRRGLEHVASIDEGRQRQANVRNAIQAVLDEQRRQRIYKKPDPEKLRMVGLQYTSWARDLALAAGAADSESVRSNFSNDAKSREFYLQKQAQATDGNSRQLPSFMMMAPSVSPLILDANTSSQISYRRKQVAPSPAPKREKVPEPDILEAIHDHDDTSADRGETMAKKAAGFGTISTDMAAILSGMGAVPSDRDLQRAPQRTSVGAH